MNDFKWQEVQPGYERLVHAPTDCIAGRVFGTAEEYTAMCVADPQGVIGRRLSREKAKRVVEESVLANFFLWQTGLPRSGAA